MTSKDHPVMMEIGCPSDAAWEYLVRHHARPSPWTWVKGALFGECVDVRTIRVSGPRHVLALELPFNAQGEAMLVYKIQGRDGRSFAPSNGEDWCLVCHATGTPMGHPC
jgi:hypothetical protein